MKSGIDLHPTWSGILVQPAGFGVVGYSLLVTAQNDGDFRNDSQNAWISSNKYAPV